MTELENLLFDTDKPLTRLQVLDMERAARMAGWKEERTNTSTPRSVADSWLEDHPEKKCENKPNGGIIRATSAVSFTDTLGISKLKGKEYKEAIKLSQRNHKKAMRNLREGEPTPYMAKRKVADERRVILKERLKNGELIPLLKGDADIRLDMNHFYRHGMKVVIINEVIGGKKYYTLDTFERLETDGFIETNHNTKGVTEQLAEIFKTRKLVKVGDFKSGAQSCLYSLKYLIRKTGLKIYTVKQRQIVIGWICLD